MSACLPPAESQGQGTNDLAAAGGGARVNGGATGMEGSSVRETHSCLCQQGRIAMHQSDALTLLRTGNVSASCSDCQDTGLTVPPIIPAPTSYLVVHRVP